MKKVYLDYNATNPIKHAVKNSMLYFFEAEKSGNPSSIHWAGRTAKTAVDEAREFIQAEFDFESPEEFIFTGSGTESINTAIKGSFFYALKENRKFHLLTTKAEHEATLQSAEFIEALGAKISYLELNENGNISLNQLEDYLKSIRDGSDIEASEKKKSLFSAKRSTESDSAGAPAILVSLLAVNNETGVLTPMTEVSALCERYGAIFHIDAVQAPGKMPGTHGGTLGKFSVKESGGDLVSFSAHKIGAAKGVGGLYLKRGLILESLLSGGSQERKRRAGTLNVAGIVGFGEAARILPEVDFAQIQKQRDRLENALIEKFPDMIVAGKSTDRAINVSNLIFPGLRADSILMALDLEGIAVSAGSACNSGTVNPSHVLMAMGFSKEDAAAGIRISLGAETTEADIEYFIETLPTVIERIRQAKRS